MKLGNFGLLEDRQFACGLVSGVGIGALLGYGLGWERALGVGPGVLSLPCFALIGIGQWFGWREFVRRRTTTAARSPKAEPVAAPERLGT
jgi:hypothetical protein